MARVFVCRNECVMFYEHRGYGRRNDNDASEDDGWGAVDGGGFAISME